ncbi:NUDIX hydrolase [Aquibacillus sediminis]|uniref:NUDIX hydrolase n=1 Tax=Aquibacillus sediminis TaxID=2574734 RepID=UPI001109E765|nr:CoA pyrophosphatase [Aquibacillus sediminis]
MDPNKIINRVKNHTPTILGIEHFSKSAVLIPLVQQNDEVHVLFEVRSQELRRQPGEICFPGGRIDEEDPSEQEAAIRETMEELRIRRTEISDVYPLDYMISPFEMIIYPYVGIIHNIDKIEPNPAEVEEVFVVPLTFFQQTKPQIHQVSIDVRPEDDFPFELIIGGENYNWRQRKMDEYFYIYEDKVIWGLTAKIMSHFVQMI